MRFTLSPRQSAAALCLLCPLAATAQPLPAQDTIPTLQDIVVTASRSPEPLADAVGDVTVISHRQLQAAQGASLAQIIGRAPGVQLATNGGPQTATSVFLRGTNPNQTLVLIDGMRINGSTAGLAAFPALDPAVVERVEILRGAASSLYGSDAIGGVINIITRKGSQEKPFSAWANAGYGSNDTAKSSLGLSGASHGWDYRVSTSTETSRGFNATQAHLANGRPNFNDAPDRDGYHGSAFSGTLGYRWAEGHRIGLTAYNGFKLGDYDAGGLPHTQAYYRQQAYSLSSSDRLTDWWHSDLRLGFTQDTYDDRAFLNVLSSLKRSASWTNTFTPLKGQSLAVLLERQEERIQSNSTDYTQDARDTDAAALIYQGTFGPVHTQASVRNDRISSYGNETTGSLGVDLDLTDRWQVGIAGHTGFRMPTFNDLYWPFQSFGAFGSFSGNPNLQPEKSRNVEAHVRYDSDDSSVSLTIYQNRIRNLIVASVCDTRFNCQPENVNDATLRGATLSGSRRFGHTTLRGSLDLLDPRNDDPAPGESSQLPQRARQVLHLGVEQQVKALKLGAEYQYTGNRIDASTQATLGGYSLVNLTAAYDFSKSLGIQVRWNNVLDKDYVLVDGYNTPGSNVFVNLSWKM